ncbi:8320_t:CDS:2, partial [Funneliformis geosporum]
QLCTTKDICIREITILGGKLIFGPSLDQPASSIEEPLESLYPPDFRELHNLNA